MTQFGGPNAPPTCARETCGRTAWKKSPSGQCWHHSGRLTASQPRKTPYAQHSRGLSQSRAHAAKQLASNLPNMDERQYAASLEPRLRDQHDFDRLQVLVCQVIRGEIDHRRYHIRLRDLLDD